MKIEPLLLPGNSVRNQQESLSALRRNCCPESAGISVRFTQESLSGMARNQCPVWARIFTNDLNGYKKKNKLDLPGLSPEIVGEWIKD